MQLTSTSLEEFRTGVRNWFQSNLPPGWGTEDYRGPKTVEERVTFLREWQNKLYRAGYAGLSWPRSYGGAGATLWEQAVFLEERDLLEPPPEVNRSGIGIVGPMLIHHGTEEQKTRFLPKMLTGEEIWCQGFSEPDAGSDLAALRTRADSRNGYFVLNGQKVWTSRGPIADYMLALVRTDPEAPKHKGISALIVPMDLDGIAVRPIKQVNGEEEFSEVFLEDVRVPVEGLVGAVNDGWAVAITTLAGERVTVTQAFRAARLLARLIDDCKNTIRDGRKVIDDPAVRVGLAELKAEVHAARASYYRAISRAASGAPTGPESSIGKLNTSELLARITRFALSALGLDALPGEHRPCFGRPKSWPLENLSTFAGTIAAGTSQIQKTIIGERLLGLPK